MVAELTDETRKDEVLRQRSYIDKKHADGLVRIQNDGKAENDKDKRVKFEGLRYEKGQLHDHELGIEIRKRSRRDLLP